MILLVVTVFHFGRAIAQCDFTDPKSGCRYIGECKTNVVSGNVIKIPNGQGKQINPDGSYFIGKFSNGQRVYGTYYWKDGQRVENAVYENDKLKSGTYYYPNGTKYDGTFYNDKFSGQGIYYYKPDHKDKLKYEGAFENGKFNGEGILTYKDGTIEEGLWKDDVFLGAKIGRYQNQNVLKKGDTIIVAANDKKYLLSMQSTLVNKNEYGDYHAVIGIGDGIITEDGWYLGRELNGNGNNIIGYITTTSRRSNSVAFGEEKRFATNAVGCKFYGLDCDRTTYEKFKQFCDWQICKMTNTANVFSLSYIDYDEIISKNIDLNNEIAKSKILEIGIQVASDLANNQLKAMADKLKYSDFQDEKILAEAFSKYGMNTSTTLREYLIKQGTDVLIAPVKYALNDADAANMVTQFKKCGISLYKNVSKLAGNKYDDELLDNSIKSLLRDMVRKPEYKTMETDEAVIIKKGRDFIFGMVDCLPPEHATKLKKNWLFHAIKNSPEAGEAIGLALANVTIKYSISNDYKKSLLDLIENSKKKKVFLENYKKQYQTLFEKNQNNCIEYAKVIQQLTDEVYNPLFGGGDTNIQEELKLMQDYVFGNKEIPECILLSQTEVYPVKKDTQLQKTTDKNDHIISNLSGQQKITISSPTIITSISGEQFTATKDDIFEGEMKDGKVIQGKIIRNGETVKIFLNKRNF